MKYIDRLVAPMMVMDVSPATVIHHIHRDNILVPLKEYVHSFIIAVMSTDMLIASPVSFSGICHGSYLIDLSHFGYLINNIFCHSCTCLYIVESINLQVC